MSPRTRVKLELLLDHYSRARSRTLRMLVGITKEELDWHAAPSLPCAGELLRSLADREEDQLHRQASGKSSLSQTGDPRQRLAALNRGTGRFVRSLLDGLGSSKSASVLRDLEELTAREMAVAGQIDLLCRLRAMLSDRTARPIPPGRAGHAVPERKSPARKASV